MIDGNIFRSNETRNFGTSVIGMGFKLFKFTGIPEYEQHINSDDRNNDAACRDNFHLHNDPPSLTN